MFQRDVGQWGSAQTHARGQEGSDGICPSEHFYILNDCMARDKKIFVAFDGGCKTVSQAKGYTPLAVLKNQRFARHQVRNGRHESRSTDQ